LLNAPDGEEIDIIEDSELLKIVFEIGDNSRLSFPTNTAHHLLVMVVKNIGRFFEINIKASDSYGATHRVSLSNRRSSIAVNKKTCFLPIQVGDGWQYLCLDLEDILRRCFGVKYFACYEVQVGGPVRVGKIFFQNVQLSDAELPNFLRVVS